MEGEEEREGEEDECDSKLRTSLVNEMVYRCPIFWLVKFSISNLVHTEPHRDFQSKMSGWEGRERGK